ncbi:MAG: hypothetical protein ACLQHS_10895 [Candidatus Limnocylindrales bacterium]
MTLKSGAMYLSDEEILRTPWTRPSAPVATVDDVRTSDLTSAAGPVAAGVRSPEAVIEWVQLNIESMRSLAPGWDSYGARAIDPAALEFAERLIVPLLLEQLQAPALVPTANGGLALEWHRPNLELVIEIPPSSDPEQESTAFFTDDARGEEWEDRLVLAGSRLDAALGRLMA